MVRIDHHQVARRSCERRPRWSTAARSSFELLRCLRGHTFQKRRERPTLVSSPLRILAAHDGGLRVGRVLIRKNPPIVPPGVDSVDLIFLPLSITRLDRYAERAPNATPSSTITPPPASLVDRRSYISRKPDQPGMSFQLTSASLSERSAGDDDPPAPLEFSTIARLPRRLSRVALGLLAID